MHYHSVSKKSYDYSNRYILLILWYSNCSQSIYSNNLGSFWDPSNSKYVRWMNHKHQKPCLSNIQDGHFCIND